MQSLSIDENNNIVVRQNSLVVSEGMEALTENIKTRVGICQGENIFNLSDGINYDVKVLGKRGGESYLKNMIRARIMAEPSGNSEIRSVGALSLSFTGNHYEITAEVNTIYGVLKL